MELSLLPGKPVLSLSGDALGYVKCAYVCKNTKNLTALVCVDGEEEEFILPAQSVTLSDDAVIAGKARLKSPAGVPCPVGSAVFDRAGRYLGHCCGFDPKEGTMTVLKEAQKQVFPLARTAVGDVAIVSPGTAAREKKAIRSEKNATQVAKTEELTGEKEPFGLLGKAVKKPVADVADPGETVTPATLKRARENNKLLELAANTLTS